MQTRNAGFRVDEHGDLVVAETGGTSLDDALAGHLARLGEDGFSIIEGVLDPAECDELTEEVGRLERAFSLAPATNSFEGTSTWRLFNLLVHSQRFACLIEHPAVLPLVEAALDAECLLSSISSIAIGPGETAQPLHTDDQLIPLARPHAPIVINTMWALTDFTAANGATRLVPGSHLREALPPPSPAPGQAPGPVPDTVPAQMSRGSVLVWQGALWHGGGANQTSARRHGIAVNYCAGWVRPVENQELALPLDVVASFSRRLQDLCGFGTYRGFMGQIEKRRPADVLLGGRA